MPLHMSTVLSRSIPEIIAHVSRVRTMHPSHIPLFTLSASTEHPAHELSALVSHLTSLSDRSMGCLSAPIPCSESQHFLRDCITCSIAIFDTQTTVPFRSTIPGRQAVQVGRWHAFRKSDQGESGAGTQPEDPEDLDWEDVWARKTSPTKLPAELSELPMERVKTVVYLSDGSPEGLSASLGAFPFATKIGLIASSTPFLTGRPHTLFYGKSVHSSGAVGLCVMSPVQPSAHLLFPNLEPLTKPMFITESEGNLIQSLDNLNPSRLLLSAIHQQNTKTKSAGNLPHSDIITKDDHFYMAVLRGTPERHQLRQLYHITSGDPSRGTLAVESEAAPPRNTLVQIFRLPAHTSPDSLSAYLSPSTHQLRMAVTVARSDSLSDYNPDKDAHTVVLPDTFLAASENGFMVDRRVDDASAGPREGPWLCKIPGGLFELQWN